MKVQRHIEMLQYITNKGSATIDELLECFAISKATLNRDLNELVKSGNIEKVHGGVVSKVNSGEFEMLIDDKERLHISEKAAIGKTACAMLEDNDTIIIDSGSTMYYFAKELAANTKLRNLTVVTNDIKVAYTLCANMNITLVMAGGIKHTEGYDLYGDGASQIIDSLNINKCFLATSAFDLNAGVTHTYYNDIVVKKKFMECSEKCILLADSSKDKLVKRFRLCNIDALECIVTDVSIDEVRVNEYSEKGIEVFIAASD